MNLLFVSHRRDVSGAEICTQRIVERIKDHPSLVVLPEGAFADSLRQAGIAVEIETGLTKMARSEDAFSLLRLAARFPGVVQRLRRIIRKFDADLVISNALGPLPYAGPAARLAGVPNICIHYHPVLQPGTYDANLVFFLAKLCDGFVAVSKAMNRGLQISGVPAARIKTIYNGLDVADYAPRPDRSHLLRGQFGLDDKREAHRPGGNDQRSEGPPCCNRSRPSFARRVSGCRPLALYFRRRSLRKQHTRGGLPSTT